MNFCMRTITPLRGTPRAPQRSLDLGRRPSCEHGPEVEHDDAIALSHDERDIVLDQDDGAFPVTLDACDALAKAPASAAERPEDGSSSNRIFGAATSARASSTIRAMPMGGFRLVRRVPRAARTDRGPGWLRAMRLRSCRLRVGKAKRSATMPPPPPSHSRAASTLSCTLSQPKICTRWKVRRRPHRARWTALFAVMSPPAQRTRPSSGSRTPEMTSKSVVLPAPLGPMSPSTSPDRSSMAIRRPTPACHRS